MTGWKAVHLLRPWQQAAQFETREEAEAAVKRGGSYVVGVDNVRRQLTFSRVFL